MHIWKPVLSALANGLFFIITILLLSGGCSDNRVVPDGSADAGVDGNISLSLAWIQIPGGSFQMGSTGCPLGPPVQMESVSSFAMLKTEVTVAQYKKCVTGGVCSQPKGKECNWNIADRDKHPVNCVSQDQAKIFCNWVKARLPTAAEWEYAARNRGNDFKYPWCQVGQKCPDASCDYAVMKNTKGYGCGEDRTWAVCSMTKGNTDLGLCDMAGNVEELVGNGGIRGGDFHYSDFDMRCVPYWGIPPKWTRSVGFRCASGQ